MRWSTTALVEEFSPDHYQEALLYYNRPYGAEVSRDELRFLGEPAEIVDAGHNTLTTLGANRMLNLLIGAAVPAFTHTAMRLGVGDGGGSVPTPNASNVDLAALASSTHRFWQPVDVSYPQVTTNTLTVVATFGVNDGNFTWNEWGIDAGGPSSGTAAATAPLLNHEGVAIGTKTAGTPKAFTITCTLA